MIKISPKMSLDKLESNKVHTLQFQARGLTYRISKTFAFQPQHARVGETLSKRKPLSSIICRFSIVFECEGQFLRLDQKEGRNNDGYLQIEPNDVDFSYMIAHHATVQFFVSETILLTG